MQSSTTTQPVAPHRDMRSIDGILMGPRRTPSLRVGERSLQVTRRQVKQRPKVATRRAYYLDRQFVRPAVKRQVRQAPKSPEVDPVIAVKPTEAITRAGKPIDSAMNKGRTVRNVFEYIGVSFAALVIGISFFDQTVGAALITLASIIGIVLRVDSRYYLGSAMFGLVMILVLSALGVGDISNNYAIYIFVLLIFGALSVIVEAATNATPSLRAANA